MSDSSDEDDETPVELLEAVKNVLQVALSSLQ
jgi:hypothetical protein